MFFTREDILKIQQALLQVGVKDSELPSAEPVTYDDTLSIVQDGKNKQIKIKEFFKQISLWKREDFINISDKYDEHYISLIEAINLVPILQRKDGLVITFQDIESNWEIYQFRGNITEFFNIEKWFNLYDYRNNIIQSIVPDEEDLTISSPDESGNTLISLKDKVYDPTSFSGKGYKILRKNIQSVNIVNTKINITKVPSSDGILYFTINDKNIQVTVSAVKDNTTSLVAQKIASTLKKSLIEYEVLIDTSLITLKRKSSGLVTPSTFSTNTTGVVCTITDSTEIKFRNILTQDMINQANTIYIIRYDFTLGDYQTKNITISSTNSVEISEVYKNFTYYYNTINLQKGQTLVLHSASCVLLNDSHSDFRKTNTIIADNDMTVYIASRKAITYYNAYSICKSLSIPSGCVLDFQGGSISNGRIEFNNTILAGTPKMTDNIIPFGEINNDTIDMSWFIGNSGEVLNIIENLLNTASYEPYTYVGTTYNNNKRYLIPNGIYEITKMVRLFNVHDIDLDFSGATIINKMVEPWSYVDFSATICLYMLDSHDIKIHNFKYRIDPETIIQNLGKSFFNSGNRSRKDGLFDERGIYNIEVYDIVGNTENLQDIPTSLDYGISFGGFMGESYNLNVHNIVWDGPLSSIVNFEYYGKPIQSDLRGTYPHNIRVTNIKANNLYKSTVKGTVVRFSGVYDGYIGNITTHNCAETIHLYNTDDGIARTMQNIVVENINATTDIVDHNANAIKIIISYRNNTYEYDHPSFINHDANIIIRNCVIRNTCGGINCDTLGDSIIKIEHCLFENIGSNDGVSFSATSSNLTSTCIVDSCHFKNCKWALGGSYSNSIISKCVFEDNQNTGEQIRLNYRHNAHYLSIIDSCLFKLIGVIPNRPPVHFVNIDNNPNLEADGFVISNNIFYSSKNHELESVLIDRGFGVKFDNNYGDYITSGNYTRNNGNNTIGPKVDLTIYTQNVGTILDPWIGTNYVCGSSINSITGIKNRYGFFEVTVLKNSLYDITITSEDNILLPNSSASVTVAGTCFIKFIYSQDYNKWFATFRDGGNMQLTLNQQ